MGPLEGNTLGISGTQPVSTVQQRIARLAGESPQIGLTSLNQYLTLDWLQEAYRRTRKDGAVGVDGATAEEYGRGLRENLRNLLERAKSGLYRAPPVRRAFIPKDAKSNELRPIGIPTFEDKVLQRAVVMLLEPIYEQDFLDCSYGFRPRKSAHQALERLRADLMGVNGGWVLEVDVRKFFDTMCHPHLREFIFRHRVRDGVLRRLIGKWLKAGVCDGNTITHPDEGCPQGGVISPLISNIFLHYVLDKWFETEVKPRLTGRASLVRFADDFVIAFQRKDDAIRAKEVIPKRFARYGLQLHPTKTRLVNFTKPARQDKDGRAPRSKSFDFLGFTFYWGKSRRGNRVVKYKTAKDRLSRGIKRVHDWCRNNRHEPIKEQLAGLNAKLRGHFQYYGVTGNIRCLRKFHEACRRHWQRWLNRRSQKPSMPWPKFELLLKRHQLVEPFIPHSYIRPCAANP